MIWISFDIWSSRHGHFLSWHRIYRKGKRTPFCRVEKRYDTWFGYWEKPKSMTWFLASYAITFAGIPSDAQIQEALDAVKPLGLVSTDQALASNDVFVLYLEPCSKEPNWKISIPNRRGDTASITYKGIPLRVISARLDLQTNALAFLILKVWAHDLEVVMGTLDIEIRTVPEGELYVHTIRKA